MNRLQRTRIPKKSIFLSIVAGLVLLFIIGIWLMTRGNQVTVESESLNLREGPDAAQDVLAKVDQGQKVNVLSQENNFYQVRLANDQVGWVSASALDQGQTELADQGSIASPTTNSVNVRTEPNEDSDILGSVNLGDQLPVIDQQDSWVQVEFLNGSGWIRGDLVTVTTSQQEEGGNSSESLPPESEQVSLDSSQDEAGQEDLVLPDTVPINEATIVIDAGHGGIDPGAIAPTFYEKHITLDTSVRLANRLEAAGANVILTREDDSDVSLNDRAYASNSNNAHAFISIHYDSTPEPNQKSGTTSYYYSAEKDLALAETVNNELINYGLLENNGVAVGDFQVLRDNEQPSILLELGYLNNDYDVTLVYTEQYQTAIVEAIYQGLINYFE